MRSWMIIVLFLLPFQIHAESVLQAKGKQFLFEAGMYKNGDILTIFGADGKPKGSARVKTAGKSKSLAEVTTGSVAAGDTVGFDTGAGSTGMGSGSSSPSPRGKKGFVLNAGINIDLANTFKGSGTYTTILGTNTLDSTGKSGTGFALSSEAQYWFGDMFGAYGGIEYMLERKADAGITHSVGGAATPTAASSDKFSALYFTGGGLMRFGKIYIPVGIVYPMLTYKASAATQVAGQLGFQFGGGFMITERISAEFNYRITNFQLRVDATATTGTFIYTSASVTSMFLTGKFFF